MSCCRKRNSNEDENDCDDDNAAAAAPTPSPKGHKAKRANAPKLRNVVCQPTVGQPQQRGLLACCGLLLRRRRTFGAETMQKIYDYCAPLARMFSLLGSFVVRRQRRQWQWPLHCLKGGDEDGRCSVVVSAAMATTRPLMRRSHCLSWLRDLGARASRPLDLFDRLLEGAHRRHTTVARTKNFWLQRRWQHGGGPRTRSRTTSFAPRRRSRFVWSSAPAPNMGGRGGAAALIWPFAGPRGSARLARPDTSRRPSL